MIPGVANSIPTAVFKKLFVPQWLTNSAEAKALLLLLFRTWNKAPNVAMNALVTKT